MTDIMAAASGWGRRFALVALSWALSGAAGAVELAPSNIVNAGLHSLPEPCRVSREELLQAEPTDNVWIGALSKTTWIVIALCEHHAYQATEVALRVEQRGGTVTSAVLAFPGWRESEETPWSYLGYQPWLTGWAGEVTDGRITLHYKGRGIGDCGELVTYDVTEPVVRIVDYRTKFECDGAYVDPETWDPVPQQVLDDYAPGFTDRRAGALLSAVILRWPRIDWMAHAIVRTDLDGDGREEQWIGGHSLNWDTDQSRYLLVRMQDDALRSWDFPIRPDTQAALCQPAASLVQEGGAGLAIDDGLCDRLRIGWDADRDTITADRN